MGLACADMLMAALRIPHMGDFAAGIDSSDWWHAEAPDSRSFPGLLSPTRLGIFVGAHSICRSCQWLAGPVWFEFPLDHGGVQAAVCFGDHAVALVTSTATPSEVADSGQGNGYWGLRRR